MYNNSWNVENMKNRERKEKEKKKKWEMSVDDQKKESILLSKQDKRVITSELLLFLAYLSSYKKVFDNAELENNKETKR